MLRNGPETLSPPPPPPLPTANTSTTAPDRDTAATPRSSHLSKSTTTTSPPNSVSSGETATTVDTMEELKSLMFVEPPATPRNIRSNLMRELIDRDPLFYYEVVAVLGVGSMGSVAKVKKRSVVIGGSARKDVQAAIRRKKRVKKCIRLPLVGNLFRICMGELDSYNQFPVRNKFLTDQELAALESTHSCPDNSYQVHYAMKSIHLNRVTDPGYVDELKNEIQILKTLDHPHIVRAMETFEWRNKVFIIMELCCGGDLYSRDPYTEDEAARILTSILSALSYMHSKQIAHRDLKYENIMFVDDSPQAEVKLIDFGLSKKYGEDRTLTEGVGTLYSMSPDVLKGDYSEAADLWSVGVIAYMLLSSQMPFYGRKRKHIVEQIMNCKYDFRGRRWKRISEPAKEFVNDLLVLDPEERATAWDASKSTWLHRGKGVTVRDACLDEELGATQSILKYAKYTKLKKLALMVVAHRSTSQEIGILRKLFQKYDKNKNGQVSFEDFKEALSKVGYSEEELLSIFQQVDLEGSGYIRYTEFLAATIEAHGAISEERLAEAFDRIDSDDSGYISVENLREILGQDFPKSEIEAIMKEANLTSDNRISYQEFLGLWSIQHEEGLQHQMQKVRDMGGNSSLGSDIASELSYVSSDENMARGAFLEEKMASYRQQGDNKRVSFIQEIQEIQNEPTITADV